MPAISHQQALRGKDAGYGKMATLHEANTDPRKAPEREDQGPRPGDLHGPFTPGREGARVEGNPQDRSTQGGVHVHRKPTKGEGEHLLTIPGADGHRSRQNLPATEMGGCRP